MPERRNSFLSFRCTAFCIYVIFTVTIPLFDDQLSAICKSRNHSQHNPNYPRENYTANTDTSNYRFWNRRLSRGELSGKYGISASKLIVFPYMVLRLFALTLVNTPSLVHVPVCFRVLNGIPLQRRIGSSLS